MRPKIRAAACPVRQANFVCRISSHNCVQGASSRKVGNGTARNVLQDFSRCAGPRCAASVRPALTVLANAILSPARRYSAKLVLSHRQVPAPAPPALPPHIPEPTPVLALRAHKVIFVGQDSDLCRAHAGASAWSIVQLVVCARQEHLATRKAEVLARHALQESSAGTQVRSSRCRVRQVGFLGVDFQTAQHVLQAHSRAATRQPACLVRLVRNAVELRPRQPSAHQEHLLTLLRRSAYPALPATIRLRDQAHAVHVRLECGVRVELCQPRACPDHFLSALHHRARHARRATILM